MHVMDATGLEHIATNELDQSVFQQHCVDWEVGPLKIKACIDLSVPSASIELFLIGTSIGTCIVNPTNPNCSFGGSVDGFRVEMEVELINGDFQVCVELCAPIVGCKKWCKIL